MKIIIQSFGYKKSGIPQNSNLVFDVRGLPNPHDVTELKELTGKDWRVGEWLLKFRATNDMAKSIIQQVKQSAKYHNADELIVSIGCYGGKHRSQFMAEYVAHHLQGYNVETSHIEEF